MQEKNMRYGQFLRSKRVSDSRELTLKDIAEELGVSVSFVSDVEQGRRKPYDETKTEKLIEFLKFTDEDIALMYDLAAKEYLRQAYRLDQRINSDLEEVAALREMVPSVSSSQYSERVQTSRKGDPSFIRGITALGAVNWYKGAGSTTPVTNGTATLTITVSASDVNESETYEARLETS